MLTLIKRNRELIVVGALLIYPFVTFITRGRTVRDAGRIDRIVLGVTHPLQRALGFAIDGVGGGASGYVFLRGVHERNEKLETENAGLRAKVRSLEEAAAQNERLKKLLAYADERSGLEIAARVVGVNPVSTLLSVRIDRGESDGVRRGMAVVTAEGVAGQVIRTTGSSADVALVTDHNSRVAVRVQRSRARATASGGGGGTNLKLENMLRTEDLIEGDLLVTAGTDGVFPPGLVVGVATRVDRKNHGMFQTAELVPAVDTLKLEEVMVLPLLPTELPGAAATTAGGLRP